MLKTKDDEPNWLDKLLHAQLSLIVRGSLGIVFGYAFLSRAFDTGSYWQYSGALLFTFLGLRLLKRSFTNKYDKLKTRKAR